MLSKAEKETIITYDEEENIATIYTCSLPVMRKLDKLCAKSPDNYKLIKKDKYSKTYTTSKKLIRFGCPRNLSDEQRDAIRERLSQNTQ